MRAAPVWLIATALIALVAAHPAGAQSPPPNAAPGPAMDPKLRDNLLQRFASMTGGWYIDQRCNHLSPTLRRELEWTVEQTGKALVHEVGAPKLAEIAHKTETIAESETCGAKTISLTTSIMAMARQTAGYISGQTYTPKVGLALDGKRIVRIRFAQKLDDKCKMMPAKTRHELDDRLDMIMADFTADAGAKVANGTGPAANAAFARNNPACDDKSKRFIEEAQTMARVMSPGWKAK